MQLIFTFRTTGEQQCVHQLHLCAMGRQRQLSGTPGRRMIPGAEETLSIVMSATGLPTNVAVWGFGSAHPLGHRIATS